MYLQYIQSSSLSQLQERLRRKVNECSLRSNSTSNRKKYVSGCGALRRLHYGRPVRSALTDLDDDRAVIASVWATFLLARARYFKRNQIHLEMACAPRPPTASSNRNDDNAAPLPDAIPPSDSVYALLRTPSGRSAMTASPIYENIPDLLEEKPSNGTLSPREQKRHAFWSGMIDQSRMISFTRSDSQAKQHIPTKKLPARTKKKLDSNELCCACTLDPVELSSGGVGASYVNGSYTCDISDEDVGTLAAAASRNRLRLTLDLKDAEKSAEEARSMWCRSPDAFSSFVANSPVVKKLR
uniref:Uncharacterized protein n=1 Tax=Plectus sambesii TaxID=2011161 RepID=A0A914WAH6_9BILA